MRPTPDELESIAKVAKAHVRFVEFVQRWADAELKRLPSAMTNVERMQGRAQVLRELDDLLRPEAATQPTRT
jgi:hypothetical protein